MSEHAQRDTQDECNTTCAFFVVVTQEVEFGLVRILHMKQQNDGNKEATAFSN